MRTRVWGMALFDVEQVVEPCHLEDVQHVVVEVTDGDLIVCGVFAYVEQYAESGTADILKALTVEDDVASGLFVEHAELFVGLIGCGGVKSPFECDDVLAVDFFNVCFHTCMYIAFEICGNF